MSDAMVMQRLKNLCFFILLVMVSACSNNSHDEDFVPYDIKAFDVYVYNNKNDKEYYVGRVNTNYCEARQHLSKAQGWASDFAKAKRLKDWDYILCTVTSSSDCATKVR